MQGRGAQNMVEKPWPEAGDPPPLYPTPDYTQNGPHRSVKEAWAGLL